MLTTFARFLFCLPAVDLENELRVIQHSVVFCLIEIHYVIQNIRSSVSYFNVHIILQDIESDSSVENRLPEDRRPKSSKPPRRSRSNPQIRPRHATDLPGDTRRVKHPRYSPDQHRSPGKEYNFPPFRAGNPCAVATPLSQKRSPDSMGFSPHLVPLSDQPSCYWMCRSVAGMIKSKSLDKLDEIMRNDPILGEDFLGVSPSSKSTQTQTDAVYRKKKPRRKRNDRPRSQILPPTYLQLPSVTWLPSELGTNENLQGTTTANESPEARNDYYLSPDYSRATPRRRSKEEQAQIVQRWIEEVIEHKKAQELSRQNIARRSVGRERSAKLKKKSRSVPEHTFRGNQSNVERRRASDDGEETNRKGGGKLKHAGSDPSFRSQIQADDKYVSGSASFAGSALAQTVGTATDERISPSLQSRIRSWEQSFQQNNTSSSSLQNNIPLDSAKQLGRNRSESSPPPRQLRRTRASNPDLPLISHLLSGGELDSQC